MTEVEPNPTEPGNPHFDIKAWLEMRNALHTVKATPPADPGPVKVEVPAYKPKLYGQSDGTALQASAPSTSPALLKGN